MILTRTPFRVSLFGGGTDYPEWFNNYPGAVLGMAIDHYCYVGVKGMPPGQMMEDPSGKLVPLRFRVQYSKVDDCLNAKDIKHPAVRGALKYYGLENDSLEFHCFGDLPGRAGLGGSSAFTVGLVHALHRRFSLGVGGVFDAWHVVDDAIYIEQEVIKETVGCQDQVLTAHGGLNYVTFGPGARRTVRRLDLRLETLEELQYSLVLVFTGTMRDAHVMAAKTVAAMPTKETVLGRMKVLADVGMKLLLDHGRVEALADMLNEAWSLKKALCPEVSTPAIDALYDFGLKHGATGGKLLGAGAGGFFLFFVPPAKRDIFEIAVEANGLSWVPVRISQAGSTAIITED